MLMTNSIANTSMYKLIDENLESVEKFYVPEKPKENEEKDGMNITLQE